MAAAELGRRRVPSRSGWKARKSLTYARESGAGFRPFNQLS